MEKRGLRMEVGRITGIEGLGGKGCTGWAGEGRGSRGWWWQLVVVVGVTVAGRGIKGFWFFF